MKQSEILQKNLKKFTGPRLYRASISGGEIWEEYMKGFGNEPVFRSPESSVHNCNCCRSFIQRYGNVVSIDPVSLEVRTLWDPEVLKDSEEDYAEYGESFRRMNKAILGSRISGVFAETRDFLHTVPWEKLRKGQADYQLGIESNLKVYTVAEAGQYKNTVTPGEVYEFCHWSVRMPKEWISEAPGLTEATIASKALAKKESFEKLLRIPGEVFETVIELIEESKILDGLKFLDSLKDAKAWVDKVPGGKNLEKWLWVNSESAGCVGLWGNVMGTLLKDLADGKSLTDSVLSWNKKVDPVNYMKVKKPITKAQLKAAQEFVESGGYTESFDRRMAVVTDIKASDISYLGSSGESIVKGSLFSGIKTAGGAGVKVDKDKIPGMPIEEFMKTVLPGTTDLSVYLEGRHSGNLVTLTTAKDTENKKIFGWSNNYSWTYAGGLAGKSMITQAVTAAGGQVAAAMRGSLLWNESKDAMGTDLDIHCVEETLRDHVYFGKHQVGTHETISKSKLSKGGGCLDLDITNPATQCGGGVAVENIFYPEVPKDGRYRFEAHNYNGKGNHGWKAEIVFGDQVWNYKCTQINFKGTTTLATLEIKDGKVVSIKQNISYYIGEGEIEKAELWGLDTKEFHPVSLMCLSPNYWGPAGGVGNKHYFFFLKDAKCPEAIRTFHTENLNQELKAHRKVMDVLAETIKAESIDGQLSGLGFNATIPESLVIKANGKLIKLVF